MIDTALAARMRSNVCFMLGIFHSPHYSPSAMVDQRVVIFGQTKRCSVRARKQGEGLVLIVVILAILGGIAWYLYSSRRNSEKEAWAYAREVAEHIALQRDARFIDLNLSSEAQVQFPPSFRERILTKLGELGVPDKRINITGHVTFSSYFFEPHGSFRAEVNTPATPVYLDMSISPSHGPWQIDALNLTWNPTF